VSLALQGLRGCLGTNDMLAYLSMMAPRLVELRRILKPTGSIYLHCDPTASHYLKLLMDSVFGPENFLNEIIWKRTHAHSGAKRYGPVHDVLLFYTKTDQFLWNQQSTPYSQEYIDNFFRFKDPDGRRYRATILTGSGIRHGSSGRPWREIDPTKSGRHWAIPSYVRPLIGDLPSNDVQAALDKLDDIGRILWPSKADGVPSFKQYVDDMEGVYLQDIWTDLPPISAQASERLGYPTQKPESLLERIILASSQEGDLVLDPFCGCGTTISVAQRLGRRWIGIDVTHLAITLIRSRLNDAFNGDVTYKVVGEPTDLEGARSLALEDRYQFQWWLLGKVDARPTPIDQKKGSDKGIDGRLFFHEVEGGATKSIVIQVKSGHVSAKEVRDLVGAMSREKAHIGALLTLEEPTKDMRTEAATAGFYKPDYRLTEDEKYECIQILTTEDLLNGKKLDYPHVRNVTFKQAPETKVAKKPRGKQTSLR